MFNKLNALILTIVDIVLSEAIDTKRGPRVFFFFSVILPRAKSKRFIQFVSWISTNNFRALYLFLVTESVVFFLDNFNF